MRPVKVGLIGCGTIGRAVAEFLQREFPKAHLAAVCEHHPERAKALCRSLKLPAHVCDLKTLVRKTDLIIEAASAAVSGEAAALALKAHKQMMVLSAGGLLTDRRWEKEMDRSRGRLWVPSGAIAGLDGLLAAREAGLKKVMLVTRKPPEALASADYFKKRPFPKLKGKEEIRLYSGTARRAVRDFPQNINVAAVLSLAGFGPQKTRVEIWTSRRYRGNRHEVLIEAASGRIHVVLENKPSALNPKTSALAFYSAMGLLRRIFSTFQIGN